MPRRVVAKRRAFTFGKNKIMHRVFDWLKRAALVAVGGFACADLQAQVGFLYESVISRAITVEVETTPAETSRAITLFTEALVDNAEVVSRAVSLVVTDTLTPPVPVFTFTTNPDGSRLDLSWSSYNFLAARDVDHYEIFVSDNYFTDITPLTPTIVGGETMSYSLTGLPPNQDRFVMIVAVDADGRRVTTVAPTGIFLLIQEVISRQVTLFTEALRDNAEITSRATSLVVVDAANPAPVNDFTLNVNSRGTEVTLNWSTYNALAQRDIERFEIYVSDTPFSNVTLLTGVTPLNFPGTATGATLTFAVPDQDRFFAIVAVDALGNREVLVNSKGAYILMQEVISRVATLFTGALLENAEVTSRAVSLVVTDADLPAPINAGLMDTTSTTRFRSVRLDWSAYNELAQGDVDHYDIYYATTEFGNIADATKWSQFERIGAGTSQYDLLLPDSQSIYYIAVVPVDADGQRNPVVTPNLALTSVGGVSPPPTLLASCNASGIFFSWQALPGAEQPFLQNWRVFLPGGVVVNVPGNQSSWSATLAPGGIVYPIEFASVDIFGGESGRVAPPAPERKAFTRRAGFLVKLALNATSTYTDVRGAIGEPLVDGAGEEYLFFEKQPVFPLTRTTGGTSTTLSGLTANRAFLLNIAGAAGKCYFPVTSNNLMDWRQTAPAASGSGPLTFLVPLDNRDRGFFLIFAW